MNTGINEPTAKYLPDQIVLLGDSIFDNAPYVSAGESVSEQLASLIQTKDSTTSQVELLAVDGHVLADVPRQIALACSKTHFNLQCAYLSFGGNDLLSYAVSGLLEVKAKNVGDALDSLHQVREQFRQNYQHVLALAGRKFPKLTVCTVYDGIPTLSNAERISLGIFNEVILREATKRRFPVLDLRIICNEPDDYAPASPIEPSKKGAGKIAQAIFNQYTQRKNDFLGV
ncbi:SGNH/GDSL hydrolase family protein [Vibrio neonatus]|uniref:SGNH/GDSL hydrolase family protein n=1 Tax=Vibrio neonatus TaxID=278860 RepID=UPI0021C2EB4B|nr:SGNH/GDSL hydrolase family protein [Vibrio neonatus]